MPAEKPRQPDRPRCPPEIRGYVARMEEIMASPQYNNVLVPTQLAIDLLQAGDVGTLAELEACLRDCDSRIHFVAAPTEFFGTEYAAAYPADREGTPDYALYTVLHGPEEAAKLLEELGITAEENLARLETTGMLSLPPGSKIPGAPA